MVFAAPYTNLAKCEVDGKTYYEGQKFYTKSNSCLQCVCKKGFKGEFVEPYCVKSQCLAELRNHDGVDKYHAMLYFKTGKSTPCCPSSFIERKFIS